MLIFYIEIVLVGLIIGSFLNVVIFRLPTMLDHEWRRECQALLNLPIDKRNLFNLAFPRSHCRQCKHPLSILENIPILSFIFLAGKCRYCKTTISWQYPIVELLSAVTPLFVVLHFGFTLQALFASIFTWFLICLGYIDLQKQILPDQINQPFLWLGLFLSLFSIFTNSVSAILGSIFGYLILWIINFCYQLLRKNPGMGYGDFKLLAALGAWLGWQKLPIIILFSSLTGTLFGLGLILFKNHHHKVPIPFGPFLVLTGWLTMIFGDSLIHWYLTSTLY